MKNVFILIGSYLENVLLGTGSKYLKIDMEMIDVMLEPEKLKKAFLKVEEENWMFRSFLKGQDEEEIDELVHKLHQELFRQMNCIACSNCCKETNAALDSGDIEKISRRLSMSQADFTEKYLQKDENGEMMMKPVPCPFLTEAGCSIYEIRPRACREYPHTDKAEMTSRLINMVNNCEICPVVFEIFERLKDVYHGPFEEYRKEFAHRFKGR